MAVADIVKSSLGPTGLDKMIVDEVGDITITNDGATILKKLDIQHPAARILIELSDRQDQDVGDGTTSVVILGAELFRNAVDLVKKQVHPTLCITGYLKAAKECRNFIKNSISIKPTSLPRETLISVAKTSMNSKIISASSDKFSQIVTDAIIAIQRTNNKGKISAPVKNVGILCAMGSSMEESQLINGLALPLQRASSEMPSMLQGTTENPLKIALLHMDLKVQRIANVELQTTSAESAEDLRIHESDSLMRTLQAIIDAKINVVITSGSIDDESQKILTENNIIGVRHVDTEDLKRLALATGAQVVQDLSSFDDEFQLVEDVFPVHAIGHLQGFKQTLINSNHIMYFEKPASSAAVTILLRGPSEHMLDEISRSVHDALCACSKTLEANSFAPGGGAVEVALGVMLEERAEAGTIGDDPKERMAIKAFAQSLFTIPKILAANAAKDSNELLAYLKSAHLHAQEAGLPCYDGLDLELGEIRDNLAAGVIEPAAGKAKMVLSAAEAAVSLLRIDCHITLNKEPQRQ